MNLLITQAVAEPAPPPPPPGGPGSAIRVPLDAEIARAKADAAEALAQARADIAKAQAEAAGAQAEAAAAKAGAVAAGKDVLVLRGDAEGARAVVTVPDRPAPDVTIIRGEDKGGGMGFGPFVLGIIALVMLFRAFQHWTAVQAGYPIRWGKRMIERGQGPETARRVELLASENDGLRQQVSRLEERVAVLERIATDPARRVAAEIEALR
jgi:hypothetical protein